jgi:hypothetical protein
MQIINPRILKCVIYCVLTIMVISSCEKNTDDGQNTEPSQEYIYFSSNGVKDTVVLCCQPTNYFNYKDSAATNSVPISTYIYGLGNNGNVAFGFSRVNIGVNSTQTLVYYGAGGLAGTGGYMLYPTSTGVKITEYGGIGQYVAGNFTCSFTSPFTNTFYNVTCSFKVKRK